MSESAPTKSDMIRTALSLLVDASEASESAQNQPILSPVCSICLSFFAFCQNENLIRFEVFVNEKRFADLTPQSPLTIHSRYIHKTLNLKLGQTI
jgi:hypothetical protein